MWKAIIVEDEAFVRLSLIESLDWSGNGFEVAGEARNGKEALELIRGIRPHLVLCDIVMPIMDGLEVLQTSKEEGHAAKFIMLTCMNEFEYARQALECGASGYILKLSMNVDEMNRKLAKIGKELRESKRDLDTVTNQEFLSFYQSVWPLVAGGDTGAVRAEEPGIVQRLGSGPFAYVSVFAVPDGDVPIQKDDLIRHGRIQSDSIAHMFRAESVIFYFCWSERPWKHTPSAGADASLPMGESRCYPAGELASAWKEALRQLDELWYKEWESEWHCGLEKSCSETAVPSLWGDEKLLMREFEQLNMEAGAAILRRMWQGMAEERQPLIRVKETAFRLDRLFSRISGFEADDQSTLRRAVTHAQLLTILLERHQRYLIKRIAQKARMSDHQEINKIIEYIQQNYERNISLKSMADRVAMEETYVSGLFKKKMGVSLIHYLQQVRVEKAKALLVETDMPVVEISKRVGFENPNYFFKIFRRLEGISPNEYRHTAQ
ncbi:MAG: two-component system response regulator [Paenibacillaceae bacterium]|jgi:two-component system response regulator YesN|nr:two-component system response regulator [Paenibacillaceae bacterium]